MISKFALANKEKFHSVNTKGKIAHRCLLRLANCTVINDFVQNWRKEHTDWESLAAFLSTKNTGRRFKQKMKSEKQKKIDRLLAEEELERLKNQINEDGVSKLFSSKNKKQTTAQEESIIEESDICNSSDSEEYVTCFEELERTPSPKSSIEITKRKTENGENSNRKSKKLMAIKAFDLLNETDEIAIDNSIVHEGEISQKKRNKGSFFLGKNEDSDEASSDVGNFSEEEEEIDTASKRIEKKNMDSVFVTSLSSIKNSGKNNAPR